MPVEVAVAVLDIEVDVESLVEDVDVD